MLNLRFIIAVLIANLITGHVAAQESEPYVSDAEASQVTDLWTQIGVLTADNSPSLEFNNFPTTDNLLLLQCTDLLTDTNRQVYAIVSHETDSPRTDNMSVMLDSDEPSGMLRHSFRLYLFNYAATISHDNYAEKNADEKCFMQMGIRQKWWDNDTNPLTKIRVMVMRSMESKELRQPGYIRSGTCNLYGANYSLPISLQSTTLSDVFHNLCHQKMQ